MPLACQPDPDYPEALIPEDCRVLRRSTGVSNPNRRKQLILSRGNLNDAGIAAYLIHGMLFAELCYFTHAFAS